MKKIVVGSLTVLLTVLACVKASAWGHTSRYGGGGTYHAPSSRSTTRTNAYGGSATHTYGQGTTASNKYGASASHAEGSGTTTATDAYGGGATHYRGAGTTATSTYGGMATRAKGSEYATATGEFEPCSAVVEVARSALRKCCETQKDGTIPMLRHWARRP